MLDRLRRCNHVYVATPFTRYVHGHEAAFVEAEKIEAYLRRHRVNAFSPIANGWPMAQRYKVGPTNARFWRAFCKPWLDSSEAIVVGMLEGWNESDGITDEVVKARIAGKLICYCRPSTLQLSEGPIVPIVEPI